MAILPWSNMLSIGVKRIDEQHQKLVEILNRLGDAIQSHESAWDESVVLSELVQYTETHFSFEETLMQRVGYAALEAHRHEHQQLFDQVAEMMTRSSAGESADPQELLIFLRDWLTSHIMGTDRELGRALNQLDIR